MFSLTGGIEKVCRVLSRVLFDLGFDLKEVRVYSLYDKTGDRNSKYINKSSFRAFNKGRISFVLSSLVRGLEADIVILSHVNLLFVAVLIKLFAPGKRIIVYAHGVEVWRNLRSWKSSFLRKHCEIWAVSEFTAEKMRESGYADPQKIYIIPNCLDPFLEVPDEFNKPAELLDRYQFTENQPVLFTLTRLSSFELYKGYDLVIAIIPELIKNYPDIRYLLAGNADANERKRLNKLVTDLGVTEHVIFTGFITDEELSNHFRLADIFIMPSRKEGFGIVFIEAAACGCMVIGGNQDGSTQALLGGELGTLIHPEKKEMLLDAVKQNLERPNTALSSKAIQSLCLEHFSYGQYLKRVQCLLLDNRLLRAS
ncbi:glycosyltransferase family 4 protein [Daejeonella oryzae]|uniref:glycosyltransferase family 4 protein n=1 Tax=Daejeonella oryzae TaxID=1122943 RepID=UPI0004231E7D|nr:glycosyltransferase family 4 protein [Daejeonella oryzae]